MGARSEFEQLMSKDKCPENDVQDFIERNPTFLFTPYMLNHGIHLDVIV